MKRKSKDGLFQALTGLIQVLTLILFVHCLQAIMGMVMKILSIFILLSQPTGLI